MCPQVAACGGHLRAHAVAPRKVLAAVAQHTPAPAPRCQNRQTVAGPLQPEPHRVTSLQCLGLPDAGVAAEKTASSKRSTIVAIVKAELVKKPGPHNSMFAT